MKGPLLVVGLLAFLAFAGCMGDAPDDDVTNDSTDGEPLDGTEDVLTKDSIVDAPEWAVGDWFGHHIFFGSEDVAGTHINAVIIDETGGDWILAADDEEAAKWEAAWDFPMLGTIGKGSMQTTAFGDDWNIYDFPLSDGKTWTATFNPLFSGTRELTLTATFNDAIPTIGQGKKAGFVIEGVNADGDVELITDYIPEIGWYSELTYLDPLTEDPEDFIIRVWGMGQGSDWEGTYITAEATGLVNGDSPCFAPLNEDGSINQACTTGVETMPFQVSADADQMYGLVVAGALAGFAQIEFVEPARTTSHSYRAQSMAMDDFQFLFEFVELDSPPEGQWDYLWHGAGFVSFGYAQLWEIQFTETVFPAD